MSELRPVAVLARTQMFNIGVPVFLVPTSYKLAQGVLNVTVKSSERTNLYHTKGSGKPFIRKEEARSRIIF